MEKVWVNGLSNHRTIGDRSTNHSSRNDLIVPISSIRRVRVFPPRFAPVATMLNSRNIISWVQGNCFIARNNGPVFTAGPLITLLLSIALFGDYTWRRFNKRSKPSPFCIVEFSFIAKIMFSCNFFLFREWERGKEKENELWNENEKMVWNFIIQRGEYFWRENVDCIIKLICVRRILNDISLKI